MALKFNKTDHPLYMTWKMMNVRCNRPTYSGYNYYGGRGVKVCQRWQGKTGFVNFLADMGERPYKHTLDRIDNNGNYEPNNCRWASKNLQELNKNIRKDNKVGYKGVQKKGNYFRARITLNGIVYRLGWYETAQQAAVAYENKLKQFKSTIAL